MSTHWYLFPTFLRRDDLYTFNVKKPCSYCPESLLIYSFYGSLEQDTSVALVSRYKCQSYKLFKISYAKTAWWGLIAGVARGVHSQKIKLPRKNLEITRFFKRQEILVISLVFQSKILSCIQMNIYSNSVWAQLPSVAKAGDASKLKISTIVAERIDTNKCIINH